MHHDNETKLDFLADEIKRTIDGYEQEMFKEKKRDKKRLWLAGILASNHILDMIEIIQTR
jgi:hypothetical protein